MHKEIGSEAILPDSKVGQEAGWWYEFERGVMLEEISMEIKFVRKLWWKQTKEMTLGYL